MVATHPFAGLPGVTGEPGGAKYAILDLGAQALAWQPPGSRPVLWVSKESQFVPGVAVRGGVPVVFPWFGRGPDGTRHPSHGYARITDWQRVSVNHSDAELRVVYALPEADGLTAGLQAVFTPTDFSVSLSVTNTAAEPATYEAALHTYLAVGDIRQASIDGLDGASYLDMAGDDPGPHLQAGQVRFDAETDRLYTHSGTAVLHDPAWGRSVVVEKSGSTGTVIWNPWIDKAARLSDFGDDEWQEMVCIEAANVRDHAVTLQAGETSELVSSLQVRPLA